MDIGNTIRKYRKELGFTQEEMATRLGVTTPAVNKWENGNTLPDISLLAPIARLLRITTDELLAYKDELTDDEISFFVKDLSMKIYGNAPFEDMFNLAKEKVEQYPNCENLKWKVAITLNSALIMKSILNEDKYCDTIALWYSQLIDAKDPKIRKTAAESLFHLKMSKKEYDKAHEYLKYFSDENPDKKLFTANILAKTGKDTEAYRTYESLMFEQLSRLRMIVDALHVFCLEKNDMKLAKRTSELNCNLAKCFDLGPYQENAFKLQLAAHEKDIDATAKIMKKLIDNTDTILDYAKSDFFSHVETGNVGDEFYENFKAKLIKRFVEDECFDYMHDNDYWKSLA